MRYKKTLLFMAALAAPFAGGRLLAQQDAGGAPVSVTPNWMLHEQATWIDQYHPSFESPYSGANSLLGTSENLRTFSFSVFSGIELPGDLDVLYTPEFFQGHGLSNTLGVAGFPNGEAVKAAFPNLHYNTSRLLLQRTFGLGGETEKVEYSPTQLPETVDVNRVVVSVGKFAANDFFDGNDYSHDPRGQFFNWALWESAAWDYAADVVGYTAGAVVEYNTRDWELHYGIFMMPTVSNGARLDPHLLDAHAQVLEFDRRYKEDGHPGVVRPFVYWNEARMGNYSDALAAPSITNALTDSRAYRSKVGFGVSWNQELTEDLGAFARLSWDDGRTESFVFTEVDRSAAVGLSLAGTRWGRKDDTLGVAGVVNGIVGDHQAYLAAGGEEGLVLGDGGLRYGQEPIVEAYYSFQATRWLALSPDFQFIANPGYNRDRGPVPIYALRAHVEF
jgi:high affinity Mn2+ porin